MTRSKLAAALVILSLGAGCATSSPTYKRPAYVVDGVVAGLGALLIGSSAASRADNPGGDDETAPFVAVGGVMLVVGLGAALINYALRAPPPARTPAPGR